LPPTNPTPDPPARRSSPASMAIRRTNGRLLLASAVAGVANSLSTAPLPVAADDAAPVVTRVPMGA